MPIDYVYDATDNVLCVCPYGTLSVPDVRQYLEDLIDDERISNPATEVIRFDDVENFRFAMITDLPRMLPRLREAKKLGATVFVADNFLQAVVGRLMVRLLWLQDPGYPTRVVYGGKDLHRTLRELNVVTTGGATAEIHMNGRNARDQL